MGCDVGANTTETVKLEGLTKVEALRVTLLKADELERLVPRAPELTADVRSFDILENSPAAPVESVDMLIEKLTSTELDVKSRRLRATSVATTLIIESLSTPEIDEATDTLNCAV